MKTFTSLLIGCSLVLAGAALAQQPNEQPTPKNKQGAGKTHTTQAPPGANAAKPEATAAKQHGARNERATPKGQKGEAPPKPAVSTATERNVSGQPAASATPGAKQQTGQHRKGTKTPTANTKAAPSASPATAAKTSATPATAAASASAAPSVSAAGQQNAQAKGTGAAKKPDPQQVQQIKSQHANFRAQPKPQQVPPVTFNQNYRIQGSDQWQGSQYEVFRSYRPERHDQEWYSTRNSIVELIVDG